MTPCQRCGAPGPRRTSALLCEPCRATLAEAGLLWCSRGRHEVATAQRNWCTACRTAYVAEYRRAMAERAARQEARNAR